MGYDNIRPPVNEYNILRIIYDYKHVEDNNWKWFKEEINNRINKVDLLNILKYNNSNIKQLNLI